MPDDELDPRQFAAAFQRFLDQYTAALPPPTNEVRERVAAHLGVDPTTLSATRANFAENDLPNLQLAMNELLAGDDRQFALGLPAELTHYGGFSLTSVLGGRFGGPSQLSPIEYTNVAVGPDAVLACARMALYLLVLDGAPVAALVSMAERHGPDPGLRVEIMSPETAAPTRLLGRLRELVDRHNVYRGKLLSFTFTEYGTFGLDFHRLPAIGRSDLILPAADLDAIEAHTVVMADRTDDLRRAGQHLKRGLLLYGPPGTGKTHSVMYLCGRMPGRTTVLLTGPASGALGQAVAIARSLQPSMVIVEDVDLIAMDRDMPGMGTNPLLFQLLDEMDGLAEDADVIFVLTTNRVDVLEPALAARPGRIDQAVEIRLPDAACRARLLRLYLGSTTVDEDLTAVVERTAGASAAFIKELVRRATLRVVIAVGTDRPPAPAASDLAAALTDLLEHSAPALRTILGAARDDGSLGAYR